MIRNVDDKKVIVFGTGNALNNMLSDFPFDISYFVDNDKKKWGKEVYNRKIRNPEELLNEEQDKIVVFIASSFYKDISKQLIRYGLKEDVNFFDGVKYWRVVRDYQYDFERYYKYSYRDSDRVNFKQLESKIIAIYHIIEKGLSLKNIKLGFGQENIYKLLELLEHYISLGFDKNNDVYKIAISALKNYLEFHKGKKYDLPIELVEKILMLDECTDLSLSGVLHVNRIEIERLKNIDFKNFVESRYSIRNFAPGEIDLHLIKDAVKIAQKSPSVCNRQSSKVYVIENKELQKKILQMQNGNRGFGEDADKLLIITSNINAFSGSKERNQSFIDGGLFAMTLLYSIHYLGLGACALNWCVDRDTDIEIHKILNIEDSENIIFLVAVGHIPEELYVANSKRKDLEEILTII